MDPVDDDIIGLTEITEIFLNISPSRLRFAQSGWANSSRKRPALNQRISNLILVAEL